MLDLLDISSFDEFYHIFETSFPINERRPYSAERELLSRDDFKILIHRDDDMIKGFISIYELENIIFAEHFAIDEKYRNMGLGARIIKNLINQTDKMICLEAEPPITDIAKRRIDFYKRAGFYYNDYFYIQPALADGQGEVELKIMTTQKAISEEEFESIRDNLYKIVYDKNRVSK